MKILGVPVLLWLFPPVAILRLMYVLFKKKIKIFKGD
jgi:hypothetical protein